MAETTKGKKIIIADTCIGCGTCEGIAKKYFEVVDGMSTVIASYDEADADLIQEAVDSCPVQAISVK